jgi:hypothetical protein
MTASSTDLLRRPAAAPGPQPDREAGPRAAPLGIRVYVAGSGATLLVITLAILAIFSPALTARYAFSDDYPILFMADHLGSSPWFGSNVFDATAVSGRPLAGLLDQFFFSAAGTIDNLWTVRLVGVVGIVALALLLHWALVRSRVPPSFAALVAVLICTQPAFLVFGSWAVLFNVPYAAILGGAASLLIGAALDDHDRRRDRFAGAAAVLVAALYVYQSAAMFFWIFLAIALVGVRSDFLRAKRLIGAHLAVGAVALAAAYVTTKLLIHSIGPSAPNASRSRLVHDLVGKARWFVRDQLYHSLSLFDLTPSPWLAVPVAVLAIAGMWLLLRRERIRPIPVLLVAAALVPLSFLPSLVVAENSPTYRVEVALTSLVALYFSLGALGLWVVLRDRLSGTALPRADRLALAAGVVFVAVSGAVAARNVLRLMVEPQSTELRILRSKVAAVPSGVPRIGFVQLSWYQGLTNHWYSDELGLSSSARPWVPEPVVDLILREERRLPSPGQRPTVDIVPWDATTPPTDEPMINLRGLEHLR